MTTLPSPDETPDTPKPFPGSIPPPVPAEIAAWLRANAIPFNTSQPGTPYGDLMPLKHIIGDARLVLLGEATHGTHEFFAMKHRLFEFLVKEMEFTVFGIEDTWAGAEAINDYVQGQPGHPGTSDVGPSTAEAAHNMLNYWTWHTSEVLDMIRWMRACNDDPANRNRPKITFTGFDMQDVDRPAEYVLNYLRKVDPSQVDNVASLYGCISGLGPEPVGYLELPQERRTECRSHLEEVHTLLQERREECEKRSDRREFARALHAARIMLQAEHRYSPAASPQMRERYMAENATWLLENAGPGGAGPDAKTVLWAHNMHVSKQILTGEGHPWTPMGHYLHERFGHQVFSVGFTFGRGTFTAVTMRDGEFLGLERQEAGQPPVDSYEHYLASAGMPRMLLDLRSIKQDGARAGTPGTPSTPGTAISPETDWLVSPRRLRSVGSAYDSAVPEQWFVEVRLPEAFDMLIYFREATASSLLPPPPPPSS